MIRVVIAKLLHYRSFQRFAALQVGAVIVLLWIGSSLTNIQIQGSALPISELFTMPNAWQTGAALTRWLFFIPVLFTIQLVCAELELKLVRAHVIAGLERHGIVLAWLLHNTFLTVLGVVTAVLAVMIFSRPGTSAAVTNTGSVLPAIIGLGIYGLALLSIATMCASLTRRPVPAIGMLSAWTIAVEPALGFALGRYELDQLSPYLPFATLSTLTPWPGTPVDLTSPTALAATAYGVLALAITWLRLSRMDL